MVIAVLIICVLAVCVGFQGYRISKQREKINELSKWHTIAITDILTQIPNRVAYSQMIQKLKQRELAEGDRITIILFDVDDFKQINDTGGHLEGDWVLQKCAKMLQDVFNHPGCTVYRIGGDEFAVIAQNVTEAYISLCIKKLRQNEERGLGCRLSMGYATSDEGGDFSAIFRRADQKLYREKEKRKRRKADIL